MPNVTNYLGPGWNANDEPDPFGPVPEGRYLAQITGSSIQANSANTGSYLKLEFEIIQGDHSGRKFWANLNFDNPSEKAIEIAKTEFGSICRSVGVDSPEQSEELHRRPLVVTLGIDGSFNRPLRYEAYQKQSQPQNPAKGYAESRTQQGQASPPAQESQKPDPFGDDIPF